MASRSSNDYTMKNLTPKEQRLERPAKCLLNSHLIFLFYCCIDSSTTEKYCILFSCDALYPYGHILLFLAFGYSPQWL